jgi:superfamily II DNA or RNA helicase
LSTGINIKNLHNLIFAHPFKGKILNLQSIGRILRKSDVKNKVYLYDISDDFRKGKIENHVYKHMIKRVEIYEEEEFDYEIINVTL